MILAGNQPYLFPYLAYWQLMNYADIFVISDNLQYTKQGYINRNNILIEGKSHLFVLEIFKQHSTQPINQIQVGGNQLKILKSIHHTYRNAPYYDTVYPILKDILMNKEKNLAKFLKHSIEQIESALQIVTEIIYHDLDVSVSPTLGIINVCKQFSCSQYINGIGGQNIYDRNKFLQQEVTLSFIKMDKIKYKQFNHEFIPNLSIIDVMMFNSKEEIKILLSKFELI